MFQTRGALKILAVNLISIYYRQINWRTCEYSGKTCATFLTQWLNRPYSVKMTSGISSAMATIVPCIYCLPYKRFVSKFEAKVM